MPDTVDDAAQIVADWNERCIQHARRALEGKGALLCEDCDAEIPARRREAQPSATRCAPCQQALEGFRVHDWRHDWAARMVMAGVDLYTLMRIGGWSSLAMVERYAAVSAGHLREAMRRMG